MIISNQNTQLLHGILQWMDEKTNLCVSFLITSDPQRYAVIRCAALQASICFLRLLPFRCWFVGWFLFNFWLKCTFFPHLHSPFVSTMTMHREKNQSIVYFESQFPTLDWNCSISNLLSSATMKKKKQQPRTRTRIALPFRDFIRYVFFFWFATIIFIDSRCILVRVLLITSPVSVVLILSFFLLSFALKVNYSNNLNFFNLLWNYSISSQYIHVATST